MKETTQNLFTRFVRDVFNGKQADAARALGCERSLVCRMCNGTRSVTPRVAARIEEISKGEFPRDAFIWPTSKVA